MIGWVILIIVLIVVALIIYAVYKFKKTMNMFNPLNWFKKEGYAELPSADIGLFYADWCVHSKNFLPEWNRLKKELKDRGVNIHEHECDKDKDACGKNGVKSFPTIKINGQDYSGPRTVEAIKAQLGK